MGQAHPYKKIALVVEDDPFQRETIVTLLEESEMDVIQCESGEAAELVLEHVGGCLTTLAHRRQSRRRHGRHRTGADRP